MEELDKSKKQTKILRNIFIIILLLDAIFFTLLYIKKSQNSPPKIDNETFMIAAFNSIFEKYDGIRKGSEVRCLCIDIKVSNMQKSMHIIKLNNMYKEEDLNNFSININPHSEYKVEITEYDNSGYINNIKVTEL